MDAAGVGVARERPNPDLTYEASKDTPRQAIGGTLPIELGGKRQSRIDLANATVATTDAALERLTAEVRNDVRRAYFEVVGADQRVVITDDARTLATRARDAAKARVDAGDAPQADLTQAQLALAGSENDLTGARGEAAATRAELMRLWEDGWDCVWRALGPLNEIDLGRTVTIRGEKHAVMQAINRQLAHYPYHVGQIVMVAKHFRSEQWKSLTVPKNKSTEFNRNVAAGEKSQR